MTPGFMRMTTCEACVNAMCASKPSLRSATASMAEKQSPIARWVCVVATLLAMTTLAHARSATTIEAYNQGVQRFNAGQYSDAIESFDKAIEHDSEFPDALFARA